MYSTNWMTIVPIEGGVSLLLNLFEGNVGVLRDGVLYTFRT